MMNCLKVLILIFSPRSASAFRGTNNIGVNAVVKGVDSSPPSPVCVWFRSSIGCGFGLPLCAASAFRGTNSIGVNATPDNLDTAMQRHDHN